MKEKYLSIFARLVALVILLITSQYGSSVTHSGFIIRDQSRHLTIEQILTLCPKLPCTHAKTSKYLEPGIQWLGFPLADFSAQGDLFISSQSRHIETDFYFSSDGEVIKHIKGGYHFHDPQAGLYSFKDISRIYTRPNSDNILWMRVHLELKNPNIFEVASYEETFADEVLKNSFRAIYTGIIGAMILYNFFLFVSTRDALHLYYMAFILVIFLPTFFSEMMLLSPLPQVAIFATYFLPFIGLFAIAFTNRYLQEELSPPYRKTNRWLLYIYGLLIFGFTPLTGQQRLQYATITTLLACSWCIYLNITYAYRRFSADKLLMVFGWLFFFIGVLVFGLEKLEAIPSTWVSRGSYRIGQIWEVSFISIALVLRHRLNEGSLRTIEKKNDSFAQLLQAMHGEIIRFHRSVKDAISKYPPSSRHQDKNIGRIRRSLESIFQIASQINQLNLNFNNKIETVPVDVHDVLSELGFLFEHRLEIKNITLELKAFRDDLLVWGNRSILIHQILSNLISNAIKFSPYGSMITIFVTEMEDQVDISIKDPGVGIPNYLMEKIFSKSEHSNRSGTDGELGTGFGVPLVDSFTKKLGGELFIESKTIDEHIDHGTTVTIRLKKAG